MDSVVDGLSFEELIGALLSAKDFIEEEDDYDQSGDIENEELHESYKDWPNDFMGRCL
jgi:hypothetical protein